MKILILHGPNLGMLGKREPEHYGTMTLADINGAIKNAADSCGAATAFCQSNHEGVIIDNILAAPDNGFDGIIINPAAYTHTSVAILDAIRAIDIPVVEVHLSNIHSREEYRHRSVTAPACAGVIAGFGVDSYLLALEAVIRCVEKEKNRDL